MSGKLTPKQRRFVEEYLIDSNATQAAIRACYSQKTANEQGARLLVNVSIQEAIAEGQAKAAERNEITVDNLLAELEESRKSALSQPTPQVSAAVAATMGKAKMLGFLADNVQLTGKNGGPIETVQAVSDDELAKRIARSLLPAN